MPAWHSVEGEIIADINLDGSVDASGNAVMTIQVLWKQDGDDIPINVVFNGKRNEIEWMTVAGKLTIAMEGYDITEGGSDATIRIAKPEMTVCTHSCCPISALRLTRQASLQNSATSESTM